LSDGRFDTALFDVGSFDETPNVFANPYIVERTMKRTAAATLVRADGLVLKRQATPKLTRRQE
jgi:hypothetical protein